MKENEILNKYYNEYDEDNRFTQDKAHQVEFITTTKYIDSYLKDNARILEVGAGTGVYSLYYAKKGYQVDAIELVEHNIDVFKSKIQQEMNVNVKQGTAVDLSCYDDNTFDITLLLGPLYHLYTEEDKNKAISEAIRVTKKGGKIFVAYLTHDSIFLSYCLKKHHLLEVDRLCDKEYRFIDDPNEIFTGFYINEFNKLMEKQNCTFIKNIATDGISSILRDYVNDLSEEEFDVWIKYHLYKCEQSDLQGYSNHMLYICEK